MQNHRSKEEILDAINKTAEAFKQNQIEMIGKTCRSLADCIVEMVELGHGQPDLPHDLKFVAAYAEHISNGVEAGFIKAIYGLQHLAPLLVLPAREQRRLLESPMLVVGLKADGSEKKMSWFAMKESDLLLVLDTDKRKLRTRDEVIEIASQRANDKQDRMQAVPMVVLYIDPTDGSRKPVLKKNPKINQDDLVALKKLAAAL